MYYSIFQLKKYLQLFKTLCGPSETCLQVDSQGYVFPTFEYEQFKIFSIEVSDWYLHQQFYLSCKISHLLLLVGSIYVKSSHKTPQNF